MLVFKKNDLEASFAPYACFSKKSRGRAHKEEEAVGRSVYQRDRDRILHSGAFRKLKYKTQVFVYHEGDYYRTRLTHSLEVAQIARSLSRALGLNEDLAEALALAHDFGHTPFGHAGEDALDKLMRPYGGFDHNDQTLRIITHLEQRYAEFDGLNLTWETIEGICKHNGPVPKNSSQTIQEIDSLMGLELSLFGSLESQIAALADDVAYNAHDLDDGLRAGLFSFQDLSDVTIIKPIITMLSDRYPGISKGRMIHELSRRTVNLLVTDLLTETHSRLLRIKPSSSQDVRAANIPMVCFSGPLQEQIEELKSFLFQSMYRHYKVNRMASKAQRIIKGLFELFMSEPNCLPVEWQNNHQTNSNLMQARRVSDYIAGMTDRYALLEYDRLFDYKAKV
ncbi:MAG: deoxyguanosinetriphosphate triphosphohydrolase [Alphaproteobacteria bacterium]|nr:deoxyguanosinetriphosphate triphosphohydrolase [Alphaproteobacteria bacterium]